MPVVVLGVQVSSTVCTGAGVPVPVKLETDGELLALLAKDAVAVAAPVAPGVNVTVKLTGVLVVIVTGNDSPDTENSDELVPPIVADDTITLVPLAVMVPIAVPLFPTTTLPTSIEVVTLSVPPPGFCAADLPGPTP
jgi:hypothetical protein